MERLPRPVGWSHHGDRQSGRSSARGKARDYSIAMADDLTEARRRIVARAASAAELVERSIAAARRRAASPRSSRLPSPPRALPPQLPTGRSPPVATRARSLAWRSRSRTCSTSPARSPAPARRSCATRRPPSKTRPPVARLRRAGAALDRPHPHVGVRVLRRRPQSAFPGLSPIRRRSPSTRRRAPGRLDLGWRGLGRHRRGLGRARLRHRRLDPHPRRAARPGRLQEHGAAGADRRRGAAVDRRSTPSRR